MRTKPAEQIHVRVTAEQYRRVRACAEYLGKTMTDVARDALMNFIDGVDVARERRAQQLTPGGFGLRPTESPPMPSMPPLAPPSPMPAPSSQRRPSKKSKDGLLDLDQLALYVAEAGSTIERDERIESVITKLKSSVPQGQLESIAEKLDKKLSKLDEQKKDPLYDSVVPGVDGDE